MADLRLGNVFNKVTAGNEAEQAKFRARADMFSGIADTLSGKDFQPGMSGFEYALVAGAKGAAQGFQSKADMKKAQAQDEFNRVAQSMIETEQKATKAKALIERETAAEKKYASIIASSVIGAKGDPEKLRQTLPMYFKMMIQDSGYEVVSITPQGDNPYVFSATVKDPETGLTETGDFSPTELGEYVFEQDQELGKQFVAAMGGFDPTTLLDKGTGKDVTFEQYQSFTPEQQAAWKEFSGKGGKSSANGDWSDADKQAATNLQVEAARVNKLDPAAIGTLAGQAAETLIDSGLDVNWLTKNDFVQGISSLPISPEGMRNEARVWSVVESVLQELTLPKVKSLGAGTGISNADREFASKIVNKASDTSETILEKMALQRAIAEVQEEYKRLVLDSNARAGEFAGMTPDEAQRALQEKTREILDRAETDPRGVAVRAEQYKQYYLQRFTAKKNPDAAAQLQSQPQQLKPGLVEDGYRFKGGNPADPSSWEQL